MIKRSLNDNNMQKDVLVFIFIKKKRSLDLFFVISDILFMKRINTKGKSEFNKFINGCRFWL